MNRVQWVSLLLAVVGSAALGIGSLRLLAATDVPSPQAMFAVIAGAVAVMLPTLWLIFFSPFSAGVRLLGAAGVLAATSVYLQMGEPTEQALCNILTFAFAVLATVNFLVWLLVFNPTTANWRTLASLGVAVVVLGVAMLFGFEPVVRLPKLKVGKGGQEAWSTFLFGISYAVASLSCTIPIFTTVLSTTFSESFTTGVSTFVVFGLGMGSLVTLLTFAVALTREGLVRAMRRVAPHFGRISGALLVITGSVVAYYGWAEHQQLNMRTRGTGLATRLQETQSWVGDRIDQIGAVRLGLISLLVVAASAAFAWRVRRRETAAP